MGFWEIFWMVMIIFALVTFTLLSVRILFKGYGELKEMLSALEDGNSSSVKSE